MNIQKDKLWHFLGAILISWIVLLASHLWFPLKYNWDLDDSVVVDLSTVTGLSIGDTVSVKNVQDLFVDIVELVLDADKKITVDMRAVNHTVAAPVLWDAPVTTFPEFGCFIIEKVV